MRLYQISEAVAAFLSLVQQDGEVVNITPDLESWLDSIAGQEREELDNIVKLIRQLDSESEAIAREVAELRSMMEARKARVAQIKACVKQHLIKTGQTSIRTHLGFLVSLCNDGGKQGIEVEPTFSVADADVSHQKLEISLDTEAIRRDLEAGKEVPYAKLRPRGQHVRISGGSVNK